MPHISATRLRIRKLRYLPAFIRATEASVAQARASAGFIAGKLLVERRLTFWTMTAWESGEAMRAFRDTGAHRAIMPMLSEWCDEAAVAHWIAESPDPEWGAVHGRMAAAGRASKLKHPAPAHLEFAIPRPRPLLPSRKFAPK